MPSARTICLQVSHWGILMTKNVGQWFTLPLAKIVLMYIATVPDLIMLMTFA